MGGGSWEEVEEENKGRYDHDALHVCMKFTKNKKIFNVQYSNVQCQQGDKDRVKLFTAFMV